MALFEIWTQGYDTYHRGDWQLHTAVKDRKVAERIKEGLEGWGTDVEIRGDVPEVEVPPWQDMSVEEFDATYWVYGGSIIRRDDRRFADALRMEEERQQRHADFVAMQALPTVRPRKRLP